MKTQIILVTGFLFLMVNEPLFSAQNDIKTMRIPETFPELWERINEKEQSSLPKSALELVDTVYRKALAEQNSPELIKALIHKLKYEIAVDRDHIPELFSEIESYTEASQNVEEQSILYSLTARLYLQYYTSDSYTINRRTAIIGAVPDDIREWTGNLFCRKVVDLVNASIERNITLQSVDAQKYETILKKGDFSRIRLRTLYDLLVIQGIDMLKELSRRDPKQFFQQSALADEAYFLPASDFVELQINAEPYDLSPQILKMYRQLLAFHLRKGNREALLFFNLDRLEFVYNQTVGEFREDRYLEALSQLEVQYENDDVCAEVLYKKAQYYQKIIQQTQSVGTRYDSSGPGSDLGILEEEAGARKEAKEEAKAKVYQLCEKAIRKYSRYERIVLLREMGFQITQPKISVATDNAAYPGKPFQLKIYYQNILSLNVDIYRIDAPMKKDNNLFYNEAGRYKTHGTLISSQKMRMKMTPPYVESDTTIQITATTPGIYEFVVYTQKFIDTRGFDISAEWEKDLICNDQFSVSRLSTVSRSYDDQYEFLVTDRETGAPIEGASVLLYERVSENRQPLNRLISTLVSGRDGLVSTPSRKDDWNRFFYTASIGNDSALMHTWINQQIRYAENPESRELLQILTDRSIYRPGQTVLLKGIACDLRHDTSEVLVNRKYTLWMKNPNGEIVASREFRTSEMGSFSGEFVLPQVTLNGRFSIGTDELGFLASFLVEEYKRPSFNISFSPLEGTYHFGDRIAVKGEARTYSDVNLQETQVNYRIVRRIARNWGWIILDSGTQIAEGTVSTDADGRFEISFTAEKRFDDRNRDRLRYSYEIQASATDSKGETQESTVTVAVSDVSMYFKSSLPETYLDKDSLPELTIDAYNPNTQKISCKGVYQIYRLKAEQALGKTLTDKDWKCEELVLSGGFASGESFTIQGLKQRPSGKYRLIMKANDDQGREVSNETDFILFSLNDTQPPIVTYQWLAAPKTDCAVGEEAEIVYGSSANKVYVLYEIFKDGKKLEVSRFELRNQLKKLKIKFKESYGDGVLVCFTFVKDSKFFEQTVRLTKKKPDKSLKLNMEVFRDRLLPGQQEQWKLSVKDKAGEAVAAEILAGMYDRSLDKLSGHSWHFNPQYPAATMAFLQYSGEEFRTQQKNVSSPWRYINAYPSLIYDALNLFSLNFGREGVLFYGNAPMLKGAVVGAVRTSTAPAQNRGIELLERQVVVAKSDALSLKESPVISGGNTESDTGPQIRQNLNETAFFYPQLHTNEAGEVVIAFTVPESNTSWKLMALAHTQTLEYGSLVREAVSRKKLMITPNMPRFIRCGDRVTIAADISNLSDSVVKGTATIAFFDPVTEETTIVAAQRDRTFSVDPGKTAPVAWTFDVPQGLEMTVCRVVAVSEHFSDGEQHLLPVLPNRMMVTESLPINSFKKGKQTYTLNKLAKNRSKTLENYRLTLEFTANPVWYAVQALPAITQPSNDDVLSWFAAYYSNSMAVAIANSTPKIKQVIDVWTKQADVHETLHSNLEKHPELKATLLEETPWVMDAKNETEQKQQLHRLFDVNRAANLSATAIAKLKELQLPDGGWSWFKGMYSNVSITQWILYGMSRLQAMNVPESTNELSYMLRTAVRFIDDRFIDHFKRFKEHNPDWENKTSISTYELEYLLVRGAYEDTPADELKEAIAFYDKIIENHWAENTNLYNRALMVLHLTKNGKTDIADAILASLREHASYKDDLGMYWANNNMQTFMSQSATTIHTFVMEAFAARNAPKTEMDKMKCWLLKQKQTQAWESVPATVNAVSVLLQTGSAWLETDTQPAITLGGRSVDTSAGEAGTGYLKQVYEKGDITPAMGTVVLTKTNDNPAWGALYWQYYEQLEAITQAKTGLNVEKRVFVEKISGAGKTLVPVTSSEPLQVGDKAIVRLTVRNDRDMEYVMLKDMRASCFEPAEQLSGTQWKEQVVYYQAVKDASTNFYFYNLPKGTYVFEYPVFVAREGIYSEGVTTIQCLYAPEFVSHTSGSRVVVGN